MIDKKATKGASVTVYWGTCRDPDEFHLKNKLLADGGPRRSALLMLHIYTVYIQIYSMRLCGKGIIAANIELKEKAIIG